MATEGYLVNGTLTAGADLSTKQFSIVKLSTTANRTVLLGTLGAAYGVLQNKPLNNAFATVALLGFVQVKAGGTITAGDYITSDAAGLAIKLTPDTATPVFMDCLGIALESAVANDVFTADIGRSAPTVT